MSALFLVLRYGIPIVATAVAVGVSHFYRKRMKQQLTHRTTHRTHQPEVSQTCEICKTKVNEKGKTILNCGHIFHNECWITVFEHTQQKTCPVQNCRRTAINSSG